MKLYCKSYWVHTVKDFIGYLFSLYYSLRVWGLQSQKCSSKCPNETLNGLFQKNFQVFHFIAENSLSLILFPSVSVFFDYSVFTVISNCNYHPSFLRKGPLPIHSHKKLHYCNWKYISEWSFFEIKNLYFYVKEMAILKSKLSFSKTVWRTANRY